MKLLYDTKQVNIDSKDLCFETPLSRAAVNGQEMAVKFLLDTKRVDINYQSRWSDTIIFSNSGWASGNSEALA